MRPCTAHRPARNEEAEIGRDGCRIGIDAATGEVRVAAFRSVSGRRIASARAPFPLHEAGDRRLVDFEAVGSALDVALREVLDGLPAAVVVERIGIASTASTVATVSASGRPVAPGRLWSDHRAVAEAEAMRRAGHPNLGRMLGHVSPEWGIAKLAAMARAGELDRRGADLVVELGDWLTHRLTGTWTACAGTREWGWAGGDTGHPPAELLAVAGVNPRLVERTIPDVRPTGAIVGRVAGRVARALPLLRDAPVVVGGMDSYLGALGCGVAEPGRLYLTIGSSSAVVVGLAAGRADGRLFGPLRTILPGDPEGYWHGGQTTAGLAARWAASVLGAGPAALEREAAASAPGARGLAFVETLLDRRTPRPASPLTGAWIGLRLDHRRGDLYRAVLEGVALGLATPVPASARPRSSRRAGSSGAASSARLLPTRSIDRSTSCAPRAAPALGAAFAHDPGRLARVARPVGEAIMPSGADYRDVRARRTVAARLERSEGEQSA